MQVEETNEEMTNLEDQLDQACVPNWEEVRDAIEQLKNNRAPGPDNLNAELFKIAEPIILENIYNIILQVWKTEKIPLECEHGIICLS